MFSQRRLGGAEQEMEALAAYTDAQWALLGKAAQRRESAREEKANNAVASGALAAEVRHNQLMRARSYARRYVPTEEVESMEASDTFRRLYGLTDANGEIKAVTRESLKHRASSA